MCATISILYFLISRLLLLLCRSQYHKTPTSNKNKSQRNHLNEENLTQQTCSVFFFHTQPKDYTVFEEDMTTVVSLSSHKWLPV